MKTLHAVAKAFDKAFRDHCTNFGVQTVPFWRLGLSDSHKHDPDELREALTRAILSDSPGGTFCSQCVPAFLLWVQTQATGHNHRLWDETVIPLLAGSGDQGTLRREQLREKFDREYPVKAALRIWLDEHHREAEYTKGENYHFWFVRAVIAECALLWVRNDFVEDFFAGPLTEWARVAESRANSEARFDRIHTSYGQSPETSCEELGSIAALKESLVEAGVRLSALARVACGQLPPAEGWTVDSLLARARTLLGITLSDLPRPVVEVLRERLKRGMASITLDQLVAFFRLHPETVFHCGGGTWTLRESSPPPVAQGTLSLENGSRQSVTLVDDLGRGPDELLDTVSRNDEGWYEQDGLRWRVSRSPFSADHPSRLRTPARPVVGKFGSLAKPDAWVWTGSGPPAIHHPALGATSVSHLSGGSRSPTFQLFAWPSLDGASLPCFFLWRFRYFGDHTSRFRLISEGEGSPLEEVWSGLPASDWVTLRRRIPAMAGAITRFSGYESPGEDGSPTAQLRFEWPCPVLFAAGRRLSSGQHLIPREGRIVLVATGTPVVRGGQLRPIASGDSRLGGATSYEVVPDKGAVLSVAAEGKRWRLEPRDRPLLRLRLVRDTTEVLDSTTYAFNERGVKVFFAVPPRLTIRVSPASPGAEVKPNELWDLIGDVQMAIGGAADSEPAISVTCGSLREAFSLRTEGQELCLSLPLDAFTPVNLLEPGFDVRRVTVCGWLDTEDEETETVGVTGHGERFAILPYARSCVLPRRPGHRGGIRLEDPSGVYRPLELLAPGSGEIPAASQTLIDRMHLSAELPFSPLRLETWSPVPLLGAWFWKPEWNLQDLAEHVSGKSQNCVRIIPPQTGCGLRVTVLGGEPGMERQVVGEDTLVLDGSTDLSLGALLPKSLRTDPELQRAWLSNPATTIRLESDGEEVGRLTLDLRLCSTAFRRLGQHEPTAAGITTVEVEAEVIPGFLPERMIEVVAIRRPEDSTEVGVPVLLRLDASGITPQLRRFSIEIPEPGEYRLYLRRQDSAILASLDITARAPAPPEPDLTLAEFLEAWPEGEPNLTNIVYLYRFLRHVLKPWEEFSLFTAVGRSRDAIRDRNSVEYRLVDTLNGYLEDPPVGATKVDMIAPRCVPPEVLAEVGTVAMHLEFYADEALRTDLPAWEAVFSQGAHDSSRSSTEQEWLRLLARTARSLAGRVRMTRADCRDGAGVQGSITYFPCRCDFLTVAALV